MTGDRWTGPRPTIDRALDLACQAEAVAGLDRRALCIAAAKILAHVEPRTNVSWKRYEVLCRHVNALAGTSCIGCLAMGLPWSQTKRQAERAARYTADWRKGVEAHHPRRKRRGLPDPSGTRSRRTEGKPGGRS